MAKIRFLYVNRVAAATTVLTASSSATALPVGAIANPDRSYVWQSLAQSGVQTIDIDLGSVQAVTMAAVANVKLVGTGVLEFYHRGDAGSPGAADLVATLPTQDRDTRTAAAFFASASHRHWQLKFTNPTSATDYSQLGYASIGTYYEPPVNARVPIRYTREDPSIGTASVGRQKTFARRDKFFAGAWDFSLIQEAMLTDLRTIWDTVGASTPIFVTLDSALPWTSWLLRFVGKMGIDDSEVSDRYTVALPWEEAL